MLYVSLHQWPFYPGSGGPDEQRETTVNVPMSAGSGDDEYLHAFEHVVEPALARFEPELLLVSAGFDAHVDDPLASMNVTADGFRELARRCRAAAPRVAAVLEGGYQLETLPALVARHSKASRPDELRRGTDPITKGPKSDAAVTGPAIRRRETRPPRAGANAQR